MILIAHRGLVDGPNKDFENRPDVIDDAIQNGYDVEVDVWYENNKWFTGHDNAQYDISMNFLFERKRHLWIHTKNEEAFIELNKHVMLFNFFWHDTDTYTMTSQGIPWIYPGKKLMMSGICVMPELNYDLADVVSLDCLGVCSDYITNISNHMESY